MKTPHDYKPYQEAYERARELKAEQERLSQAAAEATQAATEALKQRRELEAKALIGDATTADVDAAKEQAERLRVDAASYDELQAVNARAREMLEIKLRQLKPEAELWASAQVTPKHRAAVKKLMAAIQAAIQANDAVLKIQEEATEASVALPLMDFSGCTPRDYHPWDGVCSTASKWCEKAENYLNGNE